MSRESSTLLAQNVLAWDLGRLLIIAIVVIALFAVMYAVAKGMGWPIPPWAVQVFMICAGAFFAVVAIRFLIGLL